MRIIVLCITVLNSQMCFSVLLLINILYLQSKKSLNLD